MRVLVRAECVQEHDYLLVSILFSFVHRFRRFYISNYSAFFFSSLGLKTLRTVGRQSVKKRNRYLRFLLIPVLFLLWIIGWIIANT